MCFPSSSGIIPVLLTCIGIINIIQGLTFQHSHSLISRTKRASESDCGPLLVYSSEQNHRCFINGEVTACPGTSTSGSIITKLCRKFYTNNDIKNTTYTCNRGMWLPNHSNCQPICGGSEGTGGTVISNGDITEENEFPWVIAMYNSSNYFICGGSIISPNYVLSAAHCVADPLGKVLDTKQYTIIAGKYYRDIDVVDSFSQKRQIKSVLVHNDYRGVSHRYRDDIALIELSQELPVSEAIQPICIDWLSNYEETDLQNGNKGVIAGWGRNQFGNLNEVIHKLDVPYWNDTICRRDLPHKFENMYFTSDKFCAGFLHEAKGICYGDSGSGLIFKSDGKRYFLRGIASLSVVTGRTCDPNFYALYTKVSRYLDWLKKFSRDLQSTATINIASSRDRNCRLPEHQTNITFSLLDYNTNYTEGAIIESFKGITFSCNGRETRNYTEFYCISGKWYPTLDEAYCIECGSKRVDVSALVLGGSKIVQNNYPWAVAIYDISHKQRNYLLCYGSMISRYYVLTVARVFTNQKGEHYPKEDFALVAGKSQVYWNIQEDGMQVRQIKNLWIHEDYRSEEQGNRHDIALIEVGKFDLTLNIQPVCIDKNNEHGDSKEDQTGPVVTLNQEVGSNSSALYYNLTASIVSEDICKLNMPKDFFDKFYSSDKFCARTNGKDASNFRVIDGSGLYLRSQSSRFYIKGIASIPSKADYVLYTNVSNYLSWIEKITQNRV